MTTSLHSSTNFPARYRTAAEWLDDLGGIPLERIIFDPLPGTATEADLLRKVEGEKQLCELINGTLVEKPMGYVESLIAAALIQFLRAHASERDLGLVSGEAGMLRLMNGVVRIPDVSFVSIKQLPDGVVPPEPIPSLHPDLAVEILSKGNTEAEMKRKVKEYFAAGTRLVWLIDPVTRSAAVYTSAKSSHHVDSNGVLDGGDVVPGFKLAIAKLFEDVDRKKR
jgi:Uma2 family endonuclease